MAKKRSKQKAKTSAAAPALPAPPPEPAVNEVTKTEAVLTAALNVVKQPLIKICRLCEAKEGPFLNIFSATDQAIAKKIDQLLPFVIREDDKLPHKICFRCTAKVEELHDFVQKCIKSQENLELMLGQKDTFIAKANNLAKRKWEETLNQRDMSNDDICNAVIQRAMERIKGIQPNLEMEDNSVPGASAKVTAKTDKSKPPVKEIVLEKADTAVESPQRATRSTSNTPHIEMPVYKKKKKSSTNIEEKNTNATPQDNGAPIIVEPEPVKPIVTPPTKSKPEMKKELKSVLISPKTTDFEIDLTKTVEIAPKNTFDIMDHISTIKVNGFGTLFQCGMCNRNFLTLDVIKTHGCAKTGGPKNELSNKIINPPKKNIEENVKFVVHPQKEPPVNNTPVMSKPGPARFKQTKTENIKTATIDQSSIVHRIQTQVTHAVNNIIPNKILKLQPGPNNTYTVVENTLNNKNTQNVQSSVTIRKVVNQPSPQNLTPVQVQSVYSSGLNLIRLDNDFIYNNAHEGNGQLEPFAPQLTNAGTAPYPVGLFVNVSPNNSQQPPNTFTTPAMKKQSYQVLQTGNPSKLLISAKPQVVNAPGPKSKKKQIDINVVQPEIDKSNFAFINMNPSEASYVLPTSSIIQEAQISTSQTNPQNKTNLYNCNLCPETFSREKKLLAHIQAHFNKIDAEDAQNVSKKRRTRNS